jgi:AcrR family transcriptional regulator
MIHILARPGLQERSRDSFERVLAATESLLEEHLFEDVSIAEIAKRADVAVGTVYQRFPSKETFIPVLFERHNAAIGGRVARLSRQLESESTLRGRIELVVRFAVEYHVRHRGLLRALTTYVRANPSRVDPSLFGEREALYTAIAKKIVGDGREIAREDPVESALFALGVLNSVCREQILFEDVSPLSRRSGWRQALLYRLINLLERDIAGVIRKTKRRKQ